MIHFQPYIVSGCNAFGGLYFVSASNRKAINDIISKVKDIDSRPGSADIEIDKKYELLHSMCSTSTLNVLNAFSETDMVILFRFPHVVESVISARSEEAARELVPPDGRRPDEAAQLAQQKIALIVGSGKKKEQVLDAVSRDEELLSLIKQARPTKKKPVATFLAVHFDIVEGFVYVRSQQKSAQPERDSALNVSASSSSSNIPVVVQTLTTVESPSPSETLATSESSAPSAPSSGALPTDRIAPNPVIPSPLESTPSSPATEELWERSGGFTSFDELYEANKHDRSVRIVLQALILLRREFKSEIASFKSEMNERLNGLAESIGNVYESSVLSRAGEVFAAAGWPVPSELPLKQYVVRSTDERFRAAFSVLASYSDGAAFDAAVAFFLQRQPTDQLTRDTTYIEYDALWINDSTVCICMEITSMKLMVMGSEWTRVGRLAMPNGSSEWNPASLPFAGVNYLYKLFQLERQVRLLTFAFPNKTVKAVLVSPSFGRMNESDQAYIFFQIRSSQMLNRALGALQLCYATRNLAFVRV